ncbi:MAG: transglutaminase-like domain-containing protein [Eubacteriales bacterium]|nr:transglutaminase-like domain-containing protein [Eubacteriales bacterium]
MLRNIRAKRGASESTPTRARDLEAGLKAYHEKCFLFEHDILYEHDQRGDRLSFIKAKLFSFICFFMVAVMLGFFLIAAASHVYAAKTGSPTEEDVAVSIWKHIRKGNRSFGVDTSALKQKDLFDCLYVDDGISSYGDYMYSEIVGSVYQVTGYISGSSNSIVFRENSSQSLVTEDDFQTAINTTTKRVVRGKKGSYQKIKAINGYVKSHVRYDYSRSRFQASDAYYQKKATCCGYASLMYTMLRDAGIHCRIVKNVSMNHAWILVKSGSRWYQCDPTWDDTAQTTRYFMKGRSYSGHKKASKMDSTSTKLPTIAKYSYKHYAK